MSSKKLLIVIPALNEEESIEAIIERSLEAKNYIVAHSLIQKVEITVVSDGSTDRTVERARKYVGRIKLMVFETNRGYGAAIQSAWQTSDADLLGFLDADGTCEPRFFANLAQALHEQEGDLVLGCRLTKYTRMPVVRQAGNLLFAALLTLLSGRLVRDTASGMRIVRRTAFEKLRPLPSGLHFTPAMSARALLDMKSALKLIEIDMPYKERVGKSKLKVGKDGLRFLKIILKTAAIYRPARLALIAAIGGVVLCGSVAHLSRRPR